MAIANPVGFLQNVGATHNAELLRQSFSLMSLGEQTVGSLRPIGGVHRETGGGMVVQQAGTPNMSVDVQTGMALVPGSESNTQGSYVCVNTAIENIALAAAHATLGRIDRICVRVRDAAYSGASNDGAIVAVTGTPSGSPAAPAAPANSLTLATVSVPAADTAITSGQITDMRTFLTAPGGIIACRSTNRPATGTVHDGQEIYEFDTTFYRRWDGSNWVQSRPWISTTTLAGATASPITFSNIPSSFRVLKINYSARCTVALHAENMYMRINNASSGQYVYNRMTQQNTTITGGVVDATTNHFPVGIIAGASTTTGFFGHGEIIINGWNLSGSNRCGVDWMSGMYGTTGTNAFNEKGAGNFNGAGPYTRLDFASGGGSTFTADSYWRLEGWE